MNEQLDRAWVRQAMEHTLSGLTCDPALQTKLEAALQAQPHVPRRMPRLALALAVIAALLLTGAAVVAENRAHLITWDGNEDHPAWLTDSILEAGSHPETEGPVQAAMQAKRDDNAYAVVQNGRVIMANDTDVRWQEDLDALNAAAAECPLLPLLTKLPAGYRYERGCLHCGPGYATTFVPVRTEDFGDGAMRYGFHQDVDTLQVHGYALRLRHWLTGGTILIQARLSDEKNMTAYFTVEEGMSAEKVDVPGMDDAIAFTSEGQTRVYMRRKLDRQQPYRTVGDQLGDRPDRLRTYDTLNITLTAEGLDAQKLLDLLAFE